MTKKTIFTTLSICFLALFTSGNEATRVLRYNGYTNIKITGLKPFSCSEEDDFATGFTAKSSSGQTVSGVVCSGFLKKATIRF